jgi:CMP-N-acetylneuraminic acid synthetase
MTRPLVYAIIPARGGSKGIPGKNVKPLDGHPVIAYSVVAAKACPAIARVLVSTDSREIADLAAAYGAEVPFLRPAALAGDRSPDRDFIIHALDWLRNNEGREPDFFMHLRPTTPLRDPALLGRSVVALAGDGDATALRSAHELPEPPQKMFGISAAGYFEGLFPHDPRPEYYNLPRQTFPPAYHPNGYVDILRTAFVRGHDVLHGPRIKAFVTPTAVELDAPDDFALLEFQIARAGNPLRAALDAARSRHP